MPRRGHRLRWGAPVGAAAGTFASGFGAVYLFWRSGRWRTSRGLFEFQSATWGDALLLPVAAGSLVHAAQHLPVAEDERRWLLAAAGAGSALGALTQVGWLLDPAPPTNWTVPGAHRFNAPGWYHAGFLVGASGMFGGLWALLLKRLYAAAPDGAPPRAAVAGAGVALTATSVFAALVVRDGRRATRPTAATGVAEGALALGAVAAVASLSTLAGRRRCWATRRSRPVGWPEWTMAPTRGDGGP